MSGFLITHAASVAFEASAYLSFSPADRPLPWPRPQLATCLVRQDDPALWGPAQTTDGQHSLLLFGRPRLTASEWEAAKALPYLGGLAARHLLHHWLNGGDQALENALNGAAIALLHSSVQQRLQLWTDRGGAVPVYRPAQGPFALCSHPDTLADWLAAQGQACSPDLDSYAEQLSTGVVSPPYSLYREIGLLPAASRLSWTLTPDAPPQLVEEATYWTPPAVDHALTAKTAAAGIAEALRSASRRRPPGKTVLLLSGGADSRALLFAMEDPASTACLTFCDQINPEVERAREIAAVAGSPHQILFRDPDHYAHGARETIRITAGMGCIKDAHFHGFQSQLAAQEGSSLVTGCYADYLLKGLALNRQPYRFLGRALPVDRLAAYDPDFYQPHSRLAASWQARVKQRRLQREGADAAQRYARDIREIEDLRVRPLTREADAMGRLYLLGSQNWDPVFADTDLLNFYGRLAPELKLNSRAFAAAVLDVVPDVARRIPNNNDGQFPLGTPKALQLAGGIWQLCRDAIRRRFRPTQGPQLASWCSWPNFAYYIAHSPEIAALWADWDATDRDLVTDLLGFAPDSRTLADWVPHTTLFLRVLTLKLWREGRRRA